MFFSPNMLNKIYSYYALKCVEISSLICKCISFHDLTKHSKWAVVCSLVGLYGERTVYFKTLSMSKHYIKLCY